MEGMLTSGPWELSLMSYLTFFRLLILTISPIRISLSKEWELLRENENG